MTDLSRISTPAAEAYTRLMQSWGAPLPVTSGYRSPEYNAKVGGAKNSQHLHGNAYDISTSGLTQAQQIDLINKARASGFGGVGVYDNSLHFDVGAPRAWGSDYTSKTLPSWAASALGSAPAAPQMQNGGQQMADQPMGLLAQLGLQKRDPNATGETALPFMQRDSFKNTMGNLAIGLNSMRLNPDPNVAAIVQNQMAQRQNKEKLNKTTEYLRRVAPEAADLVQYGLFSPAEAIAFSRDEKSRALAAQASEALKAGDMTTAFALSMQLSPTAAAQAVAQQAAPRRAEVIDGGKYTVSYGENGQPVVNVNQAVVDQEKSIAQDQREQARITKGLPSSLAASEEADYAAIDTADQLGQQISTIEGDFGYDPKSGDFTGPLKFGPAAAFESGRAMIGVGGADAQNTRDARLRYERFITNYVNESLRLNKGTQTEGDAQRAMQAIDNAKTTADAWRAIQDLQAINKRARDAKARAIIERRKRYKLDAPTVPDAPSGWSIVQ